MSIEGLCLLCLHASKDTAPGLLRAKVRVAAAPRPSPSVRSPPDPPRAPPISRASPMFVGQLAAARSFLASQVRAMTGADADSSLNVSSASTSFFRDPRAAGGGGGARASSAGLA